MLSMVREIVFGVGFALLLPLFFGLDGVLYSMPLSDVLTFVIAVILIMKTYRELTKSICELLKKVPLKITLMPWGATKPLIFLAFFACF